MGIEDDEHAEKLNGTVVEIVNAAPANAEDVPDESLVTQGLSAEEINRMNAEFQVLLPQLLTACNGTHPRVAMAALFSAGGSIAVASIPTKEEAGKFMAMCLHDVLIQLPAAYAARDEGVNDNGNDAGEQGESCH